MTSSLLLYIIPLIILWTTGIITVIQDKEDREGIILIFAIGCIPYLNLVFSCILILILIIELLFYLSSLILIKKKK
jgi:hypothetical protein